MAYSDKVIDHYNNPRNVGSLDKTSAEVGTGLVGAPECGDVMKLQVKVNPATGIIEDAKFKTFGCGSAIASSSLATEWITSGTATAVLGAIREEAQARRGMAAEALGHEFGLPAEAFHLWLPLPTPWTRGAFLSALRSHEISVVASDAFATTAHAPEAVRIGLGAASTRSDLGRALATIAQVLEASSRSPIHV